MDTVAKNLRFALRSLLKRPAFTAVAVFSLALGIGANTTVFTLVKGLFLKPLAVAEPDRLVAAFTEDVKNPEYLEAVSYPNSRDLAELSDALDGLAVYTFAVFDVTFGEERVRLLGEVVGGEYFEVLGVDAARGRTLTPDDAPAPEQGELVAVVSHGFWERRFGSDPGIVGASLTINRLPFTVVGVMPRGFTGEEKSVEPEVWVPATLIQRLVPGWHPSGGTFTSRRGLMWSVVARLAPGATLEQAEASLRTLGAHLEEQYPVANKGRNFRLVSLSDAGVDPNPEGRARTRMAMGLLMGLVGLVLLVACANVANLLLVRSSTRGREVAIRLSLGSSRRQLAGRLLTENLVLAFLGGVLSLGVAFLGRRLLVASWPRSLVVWSYDLSLDTWVFGFTFLATLLTVFLFGLYPAWKASRVDVVRELKDLPALGGGGRRLSAMNLLVAGQIALSLVALVATGLFVRSLDALKDVDPGFDADKLAFATFDLGPAGYERERAEVFFRDVAERAGTLPGAVGAVVTEMLPFAGGGFGRTVFLEGQEQGSGEGGKSVACGAVAPGFFKTLGLPLRRGRGFIDADRADTRKVVVVNETMAKLLWGDEDPLGKRFHFHGLEEYRYVVGVVSDNKFYSLDEKPQATAWYPLSQMYTPSVYLLVRTNGDPATLLPGIRQMFQELDPALSLGLTDTLSTRIERSLFRPRLISRLVGVFGALALVLALVGVFGVVSYSVARRHREIGIRMAIGARRGDVLRQVLGQGMALVAAGVVLGLLASWAGGRLAEGFLFGIRPTDLVTFLVTPLLLLAVAAGAILLPARRAASVDPVQALKYE